MQSFIANFGSPGPFAFPEGRPHDILIRCWPFLAWRGASAICLGMALLVFPALSLLGLILCVAVFAAADGLLALSAGARAIAHHRHAAAWLAQGLLGLALSAVLILRPDIGLAALVILAGIWALLNGALLFWAALALPLASGRLLLGAAGLLSVALSVLLLTNPVTGALALAVWLGGWSLFTGVMLLGLGWSLRRAAVSARIS